jgi:hypothetical protein
MYQDYIDNPEEEIPMAEIKSVYSRIPSSSELCHIILQQDYLNEQMFQEYKELYTPRKNILSYPYLFKN